MPNLANTDGEPLLLTRVLFQVNDEASLKRALSEAKGDGLLERGGDSWDWTKAQPSGQTTSLGRFELRGGSFSIKTNSLERAARGRSWLERIAGSALHHKGTTHTDPASLLRDPEALARSEEAEPDDAIDPEVAEALVGDFYARHYRGWLDEALPALDGKTPRVAAKLATERARVEAMLRDIEGFYERALKQGQPAYDPSWMWDELGLADKPDRSSPPPLAHERVVERVPGGAQAIADCVNAHRQRANCLQQGPWTLRGRGHRSTRP